MVFPWFSLGKFLYQFRSLKWADRGGSKPKARTWPPARRLGVPVRFWVLFFPLGKNRLVEKRGEYNGFTGEALGIFDHHHYLLLRVVMNHPKTGEFFFWVNRIYRGTACYRCPVTNKKAVSRDDCEPWPSIVLCKYGGWSSILFGGESLQPHYKYHLVMTNIAMENHHF